MHKYRRMIFIAIVAILTIAVSGISTAVAQDGVVWQGSYYNNANRQGTPTFTRSDNSINFNWGNGAPGSLNNDNFSVEWVTQTYLAAGNYRFSLLADDYARIAIDGNAIINTFETGQLDEIVEAEVSLGAGNHTINVVYQELIGPAFITVNYLRVAKESGVSTRLIAQLDLTLYLLS